eukprot:11661561-Alexandrium_andersonii.AAC.1
MLPFASISPWALLELVSRWAFRIGRQGGMSEAHHQARCKALYNGLMSAIAPSSDAAWSIPIVLVLGWEIVWPRPAQEEKAVSLQVMADGSVKWEAFVAQCNAHSLLLGKGWWRTKAWAQF